MKKLTALTAGICMWVSMIAVPSTAFVGASALLLGTAGCAPAQIENEINTIIQETGSILAVADPSLSWTGDLAKAAALLQVDEAAWIKGGAVQDVINVLNDIEGVTALISQAVPYAALIGVLVAGIDAVLALLLPAPVASARLSAGRPNPFRGMTTVKSAKDSRRQWRLIIAANPALAAARL